MKTTLKQMNAAVGWLAGLVSSFALLGCGGGGGSGVTPPRFTTLQQSGVPVIFDRITGITWAAQLGTQGQPPNASKPFASELLSVADFSETDIHQYFGFIEGKAIAVKEKPTSTPSHSWAVDFGQAGNPGTFSLYPDDNQAPEYHEWMVIQRSNPVSTPTFQFNEVNGTVVQSTGLTWKLCSEGSTFNNSTRICDAVATPVALTGIDAMVNAANAAKGYANIKGWRLPTKQELASLLQLEVNIDADHATLLPSQFSGDSYVLPLNYWSSSSSTDGSKRWQVSFSGGTDGGVSLSIDPINDLAYVRLVRTTN